MDILKHKQFLLSEIKVNNPNEIDFIMGEYEGEPLKINGEDLQFFLEKALHFSQSEKDFLKKFTYVVTDETNSLSQEDYNKLKKWYLQNK
jgi:hypothetical protein